MKTTRPRVTPPIINYGKLRVDFPSRSRPMKENLKFFIFLALLLAIFIALYQVQARLLTQRNAREVTPDFRALPTP